MENDLPMKNEAVLFTAAEGPLRYIFAFKNILQNNAKT